MKRSLAYSVLVIAMAFTAACKKKKNETAETPAPEETPAPVVYPDYSKLKAGNYWIYGRFQVNRDNSVTDLHQYDSSYVEKDTLIRNQVYYKLHKKDLLIGMNIVLYLRDSLNYIVSSNGKIIFSSEDFTTVFDDFYIVDMGNVPDTLYRVTAKMSDKDLIVTVPAGTFETSSMQSTFTSPPSRSVPGVPNPRFLNMRYAKNKGLVVETEYFYAGSPIIIERRLIRYHVN